MNARELIKKWEREYEQLGFPDAVAAETYLMCAAELRAALPEQPLAKQWREEAEALKIKRDTLEDDKSNDMLWQMYMEQFHMLHKCAADLDSHESELRELLRRDMALFAETAIRLYHLGDKGLARTFDERSERIRKHLEVDSDA